MIGSSVFSGSMFARPIPFGRCQTPADSPIESPFMLSAYGLQDGRLKSVPDAGSDFSGVLWLDLLDPTAEERERVGHAFGLDLPTRAELEKIEMSSRIYR